MRSTSICIEAICKIILSILPFNRCCSNSNKLKYIQCGGADHTFHGLLNPIYTAQIVRGAIYTFLQRSSTKPAAEIMRSTRGKQPQTSLVYGRRNERRDATTNKEYRTKRAAFMLIFHKFSVRDNVDVYVCTLYNRIYRCTRVINPLYEISYNH